MIRHESITEKILLVRNKKVILDRDLAKLYGVKPIRLREQVKRNIKRFPRDFMFQLNDQEIDLMVSQIAIPSRKHLGGHKPYVFTERPGPQPNGLPPDLLIKVVLKKHSFASL